MLPAHWAWLYTGLVSAMFAFVLRLHTCPLLLEENGCDVVCRRCGAKGGWLSRAGQPRSLEYDDTARFQMRPSHVPVLVTAQGNHTTLSNIFHGYGIILLLLLCR